MLEDVKQSNAQNAIVMCLGQVGLLLADEKKLIRSTDFVKQQFQANKTIIGAQESAFAVFPYCLFLVSGFAVDYRITRQGKREIVAFHTPGSFCDLTSAYLGRSSFTTAATSAATVVFIPKDLLTDWGKQHGGLGQLLSRVALIQAATSREWIVNVGHRGAYQRTAHLLCELATRIHAVEPMPGPDCQFPFTELDLADALGLTAVHLNRALQWLRNDGLIRLANGYLAIPNWPDLRNAAGFDPGYLHLARPNRSDSVGA